MEGGGGSTQDPSSFLILTNSKFVITCGLSVATGIINVIKKRLDQATKL